MLDELALADRRPNPQHAPPWIPTDLVLPEPEYLPPLLPQLSVYEPVSLSVALGFADPERCVDFEVEH